MEVTVPPRRHKQTLAGFKRFCFVFGEKLNQLICHGYLRTIGRSRTFNSHLKSVIQDRGKRSVADPMKQSGKIPSQLESKSSLYSESFPRIFWRFGRVGSAGLDLRPSVQSPPQTPLHRRRGLEGRSPALP